MINSRTDRPTWGWWQANYTGEQSLFSGPRSSKWRTISRNSLVLIH